MSDNPFAAPEPSQPTPDGEPVSPQIVVSPLVNPAPGALTAILVISLILGGFGVLGSCMQGFMPFFGDMMAGLPASGNQNEINQVTYDVQKSLAIPMIGLAVLGLITSAMMLIGGIGGLRRKGWGGKMVRLSMIFSIGLQVLGLVLAIVSQMRTSKAFEELSANLDGKSGNREMEMILEFQGMFAIGGLIFAGVMALAFIGFYIWAILYLGKPKVQDYFQAERDRVLTQG